MDTGFIIHQDTGLIGVSTSPENAGDHAEIGILLLNAGYLHHVGPNRIHTSLARALAEHGYHSLRLDFSGLGDSQHNASVRDNTELVILDARRAMDFMQQRLNCKRFILAGLCSGAVDAISIAKSDQRVHGLIAIDGIGFRTPFFYFNHFRYHLLPRVFSKPHVIRFIQKMRTKAFRTDPSLLERQSVNSQANDGNIARLSKQKISKLLEKLINRPTKMRFIYTGGVSNLYNYDNQLKEMFKHSPIATKISTRYFPEADHLFMLEHHRTALLNDICSWVSKEFPLTSNPSPQANLTGADENDSPVVINS